MRRPFDLWLSEQVEFLAFILGLTLVLKLFVFEAFEVPTGSMQPTILGDAEAGIRDRILADKLVNLVRAPKRWEVCIFRLPHDERELYVKRLVGLPGETVEIRGGDLWIDGAIARKPPHVADSVLRTVHPVEDGGIELARAFRPSGPGVVLDGRRAVFDPEARGLLRSRRVVRDEYLHGYDPDWGIPNKPMSRHAVADLALDLTVRPGPDARSLRLEIEADDGALGVTLPVVGGGDGGDAFVVEYTPDDPDEPTRTYAAGAAHALPVGRDTDVSLSWIDRRIRLTVGGDELIADQDDLGPRSDVPRRASLLVDLTGGGVVSDVVVRRDVFYPPRGAERRWEVPPDHFFFLGDNTQASHDSRQWELRTLVHGTAGTHGGDAADGGAGVEQEVTGFWLPWLKPGPSPRGANPVLRADGRWDFADRHGNVHVVDPETVVDQRSEPAPFVHSRYLLGKVLAVYWPILDPFRWKLVR